MLLFSRSLRRNVTPSYLHHHPTSFYCVISSTTIRRWSSTDTIDTNSDTSHTFDHALNQIDDNASNNHMFSDSSVDVALNAATTTSSSSELVEHAAEHAIRWYDYGAYWMQELISNVHIYTGMPWWLSIVASTVIMRVLISPLAIPQIRSASKLAILRPELLKMQAENQSQSQTSADIHRQQMKTWALFKKYDCSPFAGLKWSFAQMPIFYSFFTALREMPLRYPELSNGGALWFTNLASADSLYIMPVLSAGSFLLAMESGSEGTTVDPKMKIAFRCVALLMIPLTASFPQGVFIYWITTSIYAVAQLKIFRIPFLRAKLGILDPNDDNALLKLDQLMFPLSTTHSSNSTVNNTTPNDANVTATTTSTKGGKQTRAQRRRR